PGWGPVLGDADRLSRQVADYIGRDFTVVVAADGLGSASRIASVLAEHGVALPVETDGLAPGLRGPSAVAGRSGVVVQALGRGFVVPDIRLAVLTGGDVTGRRRAHRQPRPRRTDAQSFFDDLPTGDYVVHHHHGV